MRLLSKSRKILANLPGWHSNRRIVVFESDDWGGIRMPSHEVYQYLKDNGLDLDFRDSKRFNQYDTLASKQDLMSLFEVLSSFRDINGNNPMITAMCVVANPDFPKIKNNGYTSYYYEPFTKTLENYYGNETPFELWKEGIKEKLFQPQFHGREHLNIKFWLNSLQIKDPHAILAFSKGMFGFKINGSQNHSFQAAFNLDHLDTLISQKHIIIDGLNLFEEIFGYRAKYFVPPNGIFNNSLNEVLTTNGVSYRSSTMVQNEPLGNNKTRTVIHWLGQKDNFGLRYIIRNCIFEPSIQGRDWIDSCLDDIGIAFKLKRPAIIGSHRVNYIGSIDKSNRENGLFQLRKLLGTILKKWPDVEFLTSVQMADHFYYR